MGKYEDVLLMAQSAISNLDPESKKHVQKRIQKNADFLHDPQALRKMIDRLDPITVRRVESKTGVRINKADLKSLSEEELSRLARQLKSQLDRQ